MLHVCIDVVGYKCCGQDVPTFWQTDANFRRRRSWVLEMSVFALKFHQCFDPQFTYFWKRSLPTG